MWILDGATVTGAMGVLFPVLKRVSLLIISVEKFITSHERTTAEILDRLDKVEVAIRERA